jgi:hypothetical protein
MNGTDSLTKRQYPCSARLSPRILLTIRRGISFVGGAHDGHRDPGTDEMVPRLLPTHVGGL